METIAEHHIEPEVASPPPRAARLPWGTSALLGVAVLLFGLFLCGGARALLEAAKLAWLGVAGRTATATVIAIQTAPSAFAGRPGRQVALRYRVRSPYPPHVTLTGGARLYDAEAADGPGSPSPDDGPQRRFPRASTAVPRPPLFKVGDALPLRFAPWFGGPISHPWSPPPTGKMLFLSLSGGLVVCVSLLLLRRIARWRRHRLHLLREGVATVGTIVHKHANTDDSLRYFVRYGYSAGGEACEHEEQVSADQWKALEVGQPVTVLYDPAEPTEAGLYQLMGRT